MANVPYDLLDPFRISVEVRKPEVCEEQIAAEISRVRLCAERFAKRGELRSLLGG